MATRLIVSSTNANKKYLRFICILLDFVGYCPNTHLFSHCGILMEMLLNVNRRAPVSIDRERQKTPAVFTRGPEPLRRLESCFKVFAQVIESHPQGQPVD
jgi:hypothetical protein